ncbi:outer membrane protein assembly factor BamD [Flavobacterium foetidum]|uniref:tetratricopeptide repeat protein n=1 Tax=Flavobacterium foetidum TaxID=2026681 RepID=UPI0010758D27|nr:tetratricopeptide repeat protein [Flavobacterium foetidum]KAF2517214.1 tetratricopeptide repeat protein [Flavobacterium foetidum]
MRNKLLLIVLLFTSQIFAQNDPKTAFQKGKYEAAISYYKKADYVKAIDLFSLAAKIKPENQIAQEAVKKVDTLREILRKNILDQAIGSWKKSGDHPVWASTNVDNTSGVDEIIEISKDEILFYEVDKKTKAKTLIKKENLIYNDENSLVSLFSEIILSDGTIWNCQINEKSNVLHVINIAVKTENGIQKINTDNLERYYVRI